MQVFDDFLTSLNEMGLIVFMISGNHDSPERVSYGGRLMKKAVFTWRLCMRERQKRWNLPMHMEKCASICFLL